jgi:hypothetical protein
VRWISTIALHANLQGKDGAGEGAKGSEGACTPGGARTHGKRGTHAWFGGCVRLVGRAYTPGGGTHALWGGRARLGGGAHA